MKKTTSPTTPWTFIGNSSAKYAKNTVKNPDDLTDTYVCTFDNGCKVYIGSEAMNEYSKCYIVLKRDYYTAEEITSIESAYYAIPYKEREYCRIHSPGYFECISTYNVVETILDAVAALPMRS